MTDLSQKVDRKFIESTNVEDYEIWTDSGWEDIKSSHKTVEYEEWKLVTEEGEELHAADDHIVFLESGEQIFVKNLRIGDKIITERGLSTVKEIGATGRSLNMFDLQVDSEEHRYYTNGILSHNTTVVGAFLTWFILFNDHKEVFVLANKEKQALEILTRIRKAILDLPFFLMRGVVKFGVGEVEFDNGSKAVAYATSSDSIRGRSAALLYIDEVAFIENDMEFWESTYPAIAQSETSRVIMTSTPKGQRGLLYKTWKEAEPDENGKSNGFHRIMVKWNDVPPYCKDPDWKDNQIKRLGEPRFKQEFECNFRGSVGTLISTSSIEQMISTCPKKEPDEWTKVYHAYDEKRRYVAVVDVGGGTGNDYSVCRVMDVTEIPYRTAAIYRNNEIDPLLFPHIVKFLCEEYGECWVLPERNNDMGGEFTSVLVRDLEYEFVIKTGTKDDGGSGTVIGGSNKRAGIRTNVKTKAVGCSNLKSMIERGVVLVEDLATIDEIGNFVAKKDSYEADEGCNDDCVMTLVIFAWLVKQRWFVEEFNSGVMKHLTEHAKEDGTFGRAAEYVAMVGGINSADIEDGSQEYYNGIPVVSNADEFFNDNLESRDDGMFSGFN